MRAPGPSATAPDRPHPIAWINPLSDLRAVVGVMVLMWAGNNVTRPFRIAGAAALAPVVTTLADALRDRLRLKSSGAGMAIIVAIAAGAAIALMGLVVAGRAAGVIGMA